METGQIRTEVRVYAELNRFLPARLRGHTLSVTFVRPRSVKDLIESIGVPHTEIDLILVDGTPADFSHLIERDGRIAVYPTFGSFDVSMTEPMLRPPLESWRFICDVNLGKLMHMLRLLGFDSLMDPAWDDEYLAELSAGEGRILLTRDRGLLMRSVVVHGAFIHSDQAIDQARYVLDRFRLRDKVRLFSRCTRCNGLLAPVSKESVHGQVPERTFRYTDDFFRCDGCGAHYWQGSHWERLCLKVRRVLN